MEHENFFADDITAAQKIDDFTKLKASTKDFLEGERNSIDLMQQDEKFDVEKSKEDVDDFLTFHDDIGDSHDEPPSPTIPPSTTTFTAPADEDFITNSRITPTTFEDEFHDNRESDDEHVEEAYENIVKQSQQPQAAEQFHAIEDDFLSPYPAAASKVDEKFISSEDLLADFKDPHPVEEEEEVAADEPEVVEVIEEPPVSKLMQPIEVSAPPVSFVEQVVEPVKQPMKATQAPPVVLVAAPVKKQTSDDTQIEAEKIFKSIGLGELSCARV